ncbi:hypothetical protein LXL04_013978 [Taraxacum kok-saghyz]
MSSSSPPSTASNTHRSSSSGYGATSHGLEGLVSLDERFGNYRNGLFSHKSRELDRELLGVADNNHINASIIFYLRLLSGHFQSLSAIKILEYLIRRYKSIVDRDGRMRLKWTIMMC